MALFKRTKKDSVLPEVDQYYEGERHDRAGLAWLLALVSVAVVALVIVGLFLGGRWVYRQVADDGDSNEVAVTNNDSGEAPSFDGESTPADGANEPADTPDDEDAPEEPAVTEEDENEDSEGTVEAPARTNVPSTGDSSEELPGTGPTGIVSVFAGVSTLAGTAHYAVSRRRAAKK